MQSRLVTNVFITIKSFSTLLPIKYVLPRFSLLSTQNCPRNYPYLLNEHQNAFLVIYVLSLPPIICRRAHVLLCFVCLFVCVLAFGMFERSDVQHFAVSHLFRFLFSVFCFVLFVFVLCLVYPMLLFSLDCLFLIAPSIFSNFYYLHIHSIQ